MTEAKKRFPLTLASVVNPGQKNSDTRQSSTRHVATPQTATQNAAAHQARITRQPDARTVADGAPETRTPTVSEAVRHAMVARVANQGVKDKKVLAALATIPREMFIEPGLSNQAYVDASLPIGFHQTISQPYIVGRMIEVLASGRGNVELGRVLEIGTGCGYQAAVLSLMAREVYSIERIKPLHELAKTNLRPMRIANIRLHYGDGMLGLPQAAPFDGIILAAAGMEVPRALLEQLAIKGKLVAPVGGRRQVLQMFERVSKHEWSSQTLEDCHFVPLRPGTL